MGEATKEAEGMNEEVHYAWAAGVLEGEGCFSLHTRKSNGNTEATIHCEMTDEDTVRRLHLLFKVGSVSQRQARGVRKPTYIWSVYKHTAIMEVVLRILPYLSDRRRQKAQELLSFVEEKIAA